MKVRQIVNSKQQKSCPIIWRSFKTVHPTVLEHIPHRLRCLPPLFLGLVFSLLICVIILIFTTMQINKWRLFGIHYAVVFTVLFFWGFMSYSYYTRGLIRDGEPVTWYAIKWDLLFSPWAPFPNALWPALFGTIFYLFVFQDGVQKKYSNFGIKLVFFVLLVIGVNILLGACYAWLESNYTYIYYNDEAWQQEELRKGNLFKPFLPLLKWQAIIFFKNFGNFFIIKFSIIHLLYTAFFTLIMYVWQSRKREQELEKLQRETEIQSLKAQLNPHFLFNSLNTIYSSALTEKDTSTAQLVQQLSGILRHSVEEVQQEKTDIQKEMAFIEKYISLQRARLPEHPNFSIQSQLYWDQEPAKIAPLILIPFVENAFQYGISIDEPSFVRLDLRIEDKKLYLNLENSITTHHEEKKGAGTGLKNAEKRLELLYSSRYSLRCDQQKDTFELHLTIDL